MEIEELTDTFIKILGGTEVENLIELHVLHSCIEKEEQVCHIDR
jgi:hypothetical protein